MKFKLYKKKWFKRAILLLCTIVAFYLFNLIQVLTYAKKYSEEPADVALVLGAGSNKGKLSSVFKERVNHAANLLNKGIVKSIIITGGLGDGQSISDSQAAKTYLIGLGIGNSSILIEEKSAITYTNIVNAKAIMRENEFNSALIISDPYHMKRAMKMCKKVGIDGKSSPTPTTMYRSNKAKRKFLINQAFQLTIYKLYGQFRKVPK